MFHYTEYSLRIGTATAWVEAGGDAAELQHLGAWATQIRREVYARMSVERTLQLHEASLSASGVTLDSLLTVAEGAASAGEATFVAGVVARPTAASAPRSHAPPVVRKRTANQLGQQQLSKFLKQNPTAVSTQ